MAQRNQERQNEYFGMTAEYNSAKNQKQRLEDAGLNPALMYGSAGSGGAGTGSTGGASGNGVGLSQAQAVGMGLQLSQIKTGGKKMKTPKLEQRGTPKIGRASCRERV